MLRRDLRRLAPGAKVSIDEIRNLLPDVLKRDVIEGERADQARKRVSRAAGKALRKKQSKASTNP